ncbi:Pho89p [Sporobolomyces koalae]|uniref:Pho89p n=1 Tax=Sporobolomyces koalae TaxID=500713 RepID=UPI00317C22CC
MPTLHNFDYIFVFGLGFSLLDAFNIGANDVANSFATSVASKSLTMGQAVLAASVMEFSGAVAVGARTASTIKNGIISAKAFQNDAGVQLLAFTCAIVASATWLMICTKKGWPVSTTYSLVSALAGVGVALEGVGGVQWGWNGGKGLATIFAGFGIAPAISAGFGAALYLIAKYGVLVRKNPVPWALASGPFFFFLATAVMTMSIIYKGSPSLGLDKLEPGPMAGAIVGSASVVAGLAVLFWMPFVHAKVVKKDYTLRPWHIVLGPALWFREAPADAGSLGAPSAVGDYRIRKDDDAATAGQDATVNGHDAESGDASRDASRDEKIYEDPASLNQPAHPSVLAQQVEKVDPHPIEGAWAEPKNLWIILRYKTIPFIKFIFMNGVFHDIHEAQAGKVGTKDHQRMQAIYARSKQFPNETEATFSFVQVMTACVNSFAHGANDVSNAVGPFAVIYHTWHTGTIAGKSAEVPVWQLALFASFIVIGLATYGYNIMAVLGNRITLHSPSRGFSMELGAAITVILASQYGLPVSTTMCITGSTIGVALCNGDIRSVNLRAIGWIVLGWVITVPVVATFAGCLLGIIINAPRLA